jgi:hypothetical protein
MSDSTEASSVLDEASRVLNEARDSHGEGLGLPPDQPASVAKRPPSLPAERVAEKGMRARRAAGGAADFVSENAVALALVGVSAGWLALTMGRQRRVQSPRGRRVVAPSRDARELVSAYPLAASAVAVAAGVGIALALPESPLENRVLSPVARSLADQAHGLLDHVRADLRAARDAAGELRDAVTRPGQAGAPRSES